MIPIDFRKFCRSLSAQKREFKKYEKAIDDQWLSYDLTFFNLANQRLLERLEERYELLIAIYRRIT